VVALHQTRAAPSSGGERHRPRAGGPRPRSPSRARGRRRISIPPSCALRGVDVVLERHGNAVERSEPVPDATPRRRPRLARERLARDGDEGVQLLVTARCAAGSPRSGRARPPQPSARRRLLLGTLSPASAAPARAGRAASAAAQDVLTHPLRGEGCVALAIACMTASCSVADCSRRPAAPTSSATGTSQERRMNSVGGSSRRPRRSSSARTRCSR
jgi:hypothetical protein